MTTTPSSNAGTSGGKAAPKNPAPDNTAGARLFAHALSALLAVAMTVVGLYSIGKAQVLLTLLHLVTGPLAVWLTWRSYRRSRVAWSFLVTMQVVLAIYYLFGAPTFQKLFSVGVQAAMFPAALYAVAAVALVMVRRDYK